VIQVGLKVIKVIIGVRTSIFLIAMIRMLSATTRDNRWRRHPWPYEKIPAIFV
jgi:hypothetical protein